MDFFEAQELARRATRRLVLLYLLAVAVVAAAVCLGLGAAYTLAVMYGAGAPARDVVIDGRHLGSAFVEIMRHGVPLKLYAFGAGESVETLAEITQIDPWFLDQVQQMVVMQNELKRFDIHSVSASVLREAKRLGFSDPHLGELWGVKGDEVRRTRLERGVRPVVKRVDTCSAACAPYPPPRPPAAAQPAAPAQASSLPAARPRDRPASTFSAACYCCWHASY